MLRYSEYYSDIIIFKNFTTLRHFAIFQQIYVSIFRISESAKSAILMVIHQILKSIIEIFHKIIKILIRGVKLIMDGLWATILNKARSEINNNTITQAV